MQLVSAGVINGSSGFGGSRVVVRRRNGTLYAIYVKDVAGLNQVFVSESADDGITWTNETQISTAAGMETKNQMSPAIAIDSVNNLHAVWAWNTAAPGNPAECETWYSKYTGSWSVPIKISGVPKTWGSSSNPSIAVDSGNNLHVVFVAISGLNQIWYTKYTGSWSAPLVISTLGTTQITPAVTVDSSSNVHVVWAGIIGAIYHIMYATYTGSWSAPLDLTSTAKMANRNQSYPSIAVDSNDYIHVSWEGSHNDYANSQIWYAKYDGSWTDPPTRISSTLDVHNSCSVAVDDNDYVYIVGVNSTLSTIWCSIYTTSWSAPSQLQAASTGYPNIRYSRYPSSNRPYSGIDYIFTEGTSPYNVYWDSVGNPFPPVVFKGMFVRGDEIQAVIGGDVLRSPDFGGHWYDVEGEADAWDVGFDIRNCQNMIVGCSGQLYVFSGADGETFYVEPGAVISGAVTQIDTDWESSVAVIATSQKLYKTINWGDTVHELLDKSIIDVALGGNTLIQYESPTISGYILLPDSDYSIQTGSPFNWSKTIDGVTDYDDDGRWWITVIDAADENHCESGTTSFPRHVIFNFEDYDGSDIVAEIICGVNSQIVAGGGSITTWFVTRTHDTEYTEKFISDDAAPYNNYIGGLTNPSTLQNWTKEELNNLKFGVRSQTTSVPPKCIVVNGMWANVYFETSGVYIVGAAPVERSGRVDGSVVINRLHPADWDGVINYVEFYVVNSTVTNVQFATCHLVESAHPNYTYTTRDYTGNLGSFDIGYHKVNVGLNVKSGDVIAIKFTGAGISTSSSWTVTDSLLTKPGEIFPFEDSVFVYDGNYKAVPSFRGVIF